jgi:hypothetical protein
MLPYLKHSFDILANATPSVSSSVASILEIGASFADLYETNFAGLLHLKT